MVKVEIIRPRPPGHRSGLSQRLKSFTKFFETQRVRRQTSWLWITFGVIVVCSIGFQFLPRPVPPPTETPEPPRPLATALGIKTMPLKSMRFRDGLADQHETLRVETILEQGNKYRLVICTRAADGLWQPHEVGVDDTIPTTDLKIIRIDDVLAIAERSDGRLIRLFHPSSWRELTRRHDFTGTPLPPSVVDLAQTEMWTKHTGTRRFLGVRVISDQASGDVPPAIMRTFVYVLEEFAIEYYRLEDRTKVDVRQMLAQWLKDRDIGLIKVDPRELDGASVRETANLSATSVDPVD